MIQGLGSVSSYSYYSTDPRQSNTANRRNPQDTDPATGAAAPAADNSTGKANNAADNTTNTGSTDRSSSGEQLSTDQQKQVDKLKETDSHVRAHEQAHLAASGGLAMGGASFEYETGPDGKRYAVGGEVQIDTSKGKTPEETLAKASRIRSAALAPSDPSGQDRAVAAAATQMAAEAQQEISTQASSSGNNSDNPDNSTPTPAPDAENSDKQTGYQQQSAIQAYQLAGISAYTPPNIFQASA
jgi:hypothetical protein